jgi:hypothetical protein
MGRQYRWAFVVACITATIGLVAGNVSRGDDGYEPPSKGATEVFFQDDSTGKNIPRVVASDGDDVWSCVEPVSWADVKVAPSPSAPSSTTCEAPAPPVAAGVEAPPAPSCCSAAGACEAKSCVCGHLIVSAEAVWLAPLIDQRCDYVRLDDAEGDVLNQTSAAASNSDGFIITPRLTLGFQGAEWGLQARYWRMNEPQIGVSAYYPSDVGNFGQTEFYAETIDLELTRLMQFCCSSAEFTIGVRYGRLNQVNGISEVQSLDGSTYTGSVLAGLDFSGFGLTTSLSGRRPVGCCNANLFYSLRGSVLFEQGGSSFVKTAASYTNNVDVSSGSDNGALACASSSSLFISEAQVGVEWDYALQCMPANAFFRVGFEYQNWTTCGFVPGTSESYAGAAPGATITASGRIGNACVNLVGLNIGTGITW